MKKLRAETEAYIQERAIYDDAAKKISEYIMPGRAIGYLYSRPQKRKLYSIKAINGIATDACLLLTSAMQGGITSPSRPWFRLKLSNPQYNNIPQITSWLYEVEKILYAALSQSNFYSTVHIGYTELANYGTAPIYVGENEDNAPFRFESIAWGEYAVGTSYIGVVDSIYLFAWYNNEQLIEKYGSRVPSYIKDTYTRNGATTDLYMVVKAIRQETYQDKPYKATHFLYKGTNDGKSDTPLRIEGYYEFPCPTARWTLTGQDKYGIGIGHRILPDIMRLQEMEKSFLISTHKDAEPPMNIPARMRGLTDFMPGGANYYSNPNELAVPVFGGKFDYMGVSHAIERVVARIQMAYFNDLFLTGSRDANASPYKAAEVNVREQEKMLRLGPIIGRLEYEWLQPILTRCINILARKQLIPPPPEALTGQEYEIVMIGVLPQAQKALATDPMMEFFQFVGAMAQVSQDALDKIDGDRAIDEFADIKGVPSPIVRDTNQVKMIRDNRAKQMAEEKQKQEAIMVMQLQAQLGQQKADTALTQAEVGATNAEMLGNVI